MAMVPAIGEGAGEDVGEVLRYEVLLTDTDSPDAGAFWEFRRREGVVYELYMGDADNPPEPYTSERSITLIRRAGERHGEPIYFIQVDLRVPGDPGGLLILGFVATRADGVGVHAVLTCADPALHALAASFGLPFPLGSENDPGHFCGLEPKANADPVGFFTAARDAGLVGWEDEMGLSLYEEIGSSL